MRLMLIPLLLTLAACGSGPRGEKEVVHDSGTRVLFSWSPTAAFVSNSQITASGVNRSVRILGRRGAADLAQENLAFDICGNARLRIDTDGLFVEEGKNLYIFRMYRCGDN